MRSGCVATYGRPVLIQYAVWHSRVICQSSVEADDDGLRVVRYDFEAGGAEVFVQTGGAEHEETSRMGKLRGDIVGRGLSGGLNRIKVRSDANLLQTT